MENIESLYQQHIARLQKLAQTILQRQGLDALLIHSGELQMAFLDDQAYPFRVNPHFAAWVPVTRVANCWLLINGSDRPKMWFYSPQDYWHSCEPLPDAFWTKEIDIEPLKTADDIACLLPAQKQRIAYIGPCESRAVSLGIQPVQINPRPVLNFFHFHRSCKTEYELFCLREAQKIAITGHQAVLEAFQAGMSEFDINMAYLMATGQRDTEVPYDNIVALNEHAAVLHHTSLSLMVPDKVHSCLVDAGAEYHGYASDITRTYAARGNDSFAALIKSVREQQQALIGTIQTGVRFTDYHLQMHQRIGTILQQHEIIQGISPEEMVNQGITSVFFPHGLGHPLGLQVHDVAGFMQDEEGTHLQPPTGHGALRCTRILMPGMVMTVEPGLYFIDTLLAQWQNRKEQKHFNWPLINTMRLSGGVRMEDNIVIKEKKVENMTKEFALS
ncbi:MAG: Xaa-Pro dipeptidase [Enterobacteriaceae bacterium]